MLFSDQPTPAEFRSNSYDDLVSLVRAHIVRAGSKEAVENALGWELDAFLESEATALSSYSAEFLQALCAHVGVDWMTALP